MKKYQYMSAKLSKATEIYAKAGYHDGPNTLKKILEKIPESIYKKLNFRELAHLMIHFNNQKG